MTRISRRVARSSGGTAVLGNAKRAAQTGATVSALLGGAVVTLSYGHLLWANAMLRRIPVLLALRLTEPPAGLDRGKKRAEELKEILSTTLVRDAATRLVFLNLVAKPVRALAKTRKTSANRVLVDLIDAGLQSKDAEKERFVSLVNRLTESTDSSERKRLKEELARMTFG